MSEERRHHSYSPSTLQAREVCPLWAPTGESNEKAETGTRQHKFTEDRVDDGSLSDHEVVAAAWCLDYAERVKHRLSNFGAVTEYSEPYLVLDDRVWTVPVFNPKTFTTSEVTEQCTTGGYADLIFTSAKLRHIELFDWKFGKWPVEPSATNLQGISYALGALRKFPGTNTVRVNFLQPQLDSRSSHVFRRKETEKHLLRVKTVVERAVACAKSQDYSQANPTVPGCLFCGRKGVCHKLHEFALTISRKYQPLQIPANITPIDLDDPEQMKIGLQAALTAEGWAQSYRRQKTQQVLSGMVECPDGYKVMQSERRTITNPYRFFRVARKFLSRKELQAALLKPAFGSLERAVSDKFPRGRKTKALDQLNESLMASGAVEKSPTSPYLGVVSKKTETN